MQYLRELAVPCLDLVTRRERAREAFDEIYRAMASAGAPDRDGQIIAIVARIVGQPARHEVVDIPVHAVDFGQLF